jgi:tetratricopeptide (TPR) repeat protein
VLKGKRRPVIAYALGSPEHVRTVIASSDVPLIGRDDEVRVLVEAVRAVTTGTGRVVEITGDAGIGKSRLVDELLGRADALAVFREQCHQFEAATPYFVVRQLVHEVLDLGGLNGAEALARIAAVVEATAADLAPWLPLIAVALGLPTEDSPEVAQLGDEFRKAKLERAVVQLLAAVLTTPTVLCFEDAHWMDEASGDVVRLMAAEASRHPWMVCITKRPTDSSFVPTHGPATVEIALAPIVPDATERLVEAATADGPLPLHLVRAVVERSDGSPLYALELVHALRDAHDDVEALPESLERLVAARIDRLGPSARATLCNLSVLGQAFAIEQVAGVGLLDESAGRSHTEALSSLTELVELDPTGTVRFRHALVHEVAYARLPFKVRRRLHGRAADWILRAGPAVAATEAAPLSLHLLRAQRHHEAWLFARRAGDAARDSHANLDAATLYERALRAARHGDDLSPGDRAAVLEQLGDVQERAGSYEAARLSYRAARRLLDDRPLRQAQLSLKDSFVAERLSRYPDAVRSVRRGQRLLEGLTGEDVDRTRAQLTVWFAAVRASQGLTRDARRWSLIGIDQARSARDESALARAYLVLGYAETTLGLSNGVEHSTRALEIYTAAADLNGQATAANNLGVYASFDGRWDDAIDLYVRSREARIKVGDPSSAALADANIAEILTQQGHVDAAARLLHAAARAWATTGESWGTAFARQGLGRLAARAGRFDEATYLLDEARAGFAAIGAHADVAIVDLDIIERLVLAGDGARARSVLGRLLADGFAADGIEPYLPRFHRLHGVALVQSGDTLLGRDELAVAAGLSRKQANRYELALALDLLHRLGERSDDDEDSEEIFRDLGVRALPQYPLPHARSSSAAACSKTNSHRRGHC